MAMTPLVCADAAAAEAARAGGVDVVLVVARDSVVPAAGEAGKAGGGAVGAVGAGGAGPGRLAVFVGDPSDPVDLQAAQVMADELFGGPAGT